MSGVDVSLCDCGCNKSSSKSFGKRASLTHFGECILPLRVLVVAIGVNLDLKVGDPDHGEHRARAYNEGMGAEPPAGSRGRAPEAESFLRIGHPKEGANWLHDRVLNDRNCNFWEMGLMGKGTIWG